MERDSLDRLMNLVAVFIAIAIPASASEPARPLRLVTYNVWNGFTERPEPRREEWLAWMANQRPDVVALEELNGYTPEKLAADASTWGHAYSVLLRTNGFPTGLTSRTPITEVQRILEGMHHGLMRGKVRGIYFFVIHFHPSRYDRRIEEARRLLEEIDRLSEPNPRIVMAGDFNGFSPADRAHYEADPALEPFFRKLDEQDPDSKNLNAGKLDYGGIAEILHAGYVDLEARFHPSTAPFSGSFPTELRRNEDLGTDRRIDYVFVSPNLVGIARSATIVRDRSTAKISDHYPLVVDFEVP